MTEDDTKFILDLNRKTSTRSDAALALLACEFFDAPRSHREGDAIVITDANGDECGRGPTEQAAIYEAIKAAHRSMLIDGRKTAALRKSLREFIEP